MEWLETGGPPVEAPDTKGFGTRIIGAIIEGQLGGAARFDWRPERLAMHAFDPALRCGQDGRAAKPQRCGLMFLQRCKVQQKFFAKRRTPPLSFRLNGRIAAWAAGRRNDGHSRAGIGRLGCHVRVDIVPRPYDTVVSLEFLVVDAALRARRV